MNHSWRVQDLSSPMGCPNRCGILWRFGRLIENLCCVLRTSSFLGMSTLTIGIRAAPGSMFVTWATQWKHGQECDIPKYSFTQQGSSAGQSCTRSCIWLTLNARALYWGCDGSQVNAQNICICHCSPASIFWTSDLERLRWLSQIWHFPTQVL